MIKSEWGSKHICPGCTAKYYDLGKEVVTCPKCGTRPTIKKAPKAVSAQVRKTGRPKFQRYP